MTELDDDKSRLIPADLKKLSDKVDKNVVKKDVYDELVKVANDTRRLVRKKTIMIIR